MDDTTKSNVDWNYLSRDWPDLIYLRKVEKLPNFPWTSKYFRKFCCGKEARPELENAVIHVAGFAAMQKDILVRFMVALSRGSK